MTTLFQSVKQATHYAKCRPTYPPSLYKKIVSSLNLENDNIIMNNDDEDNGHVGVVTPTSSSSLSSSLLFVDVGCGTGQATVALAEQQYLLSNHHVIGIDPSRAQIENATHHPRVTYKVGHETAWPGMESSSVALVTAAQAAHWFDIPKFYREADRVLMPGGVLALWTYGNQTFPDDPFLEQIIVQEFYTELLKNGGYWDDRRQLVDDRYQDIPLISETTCNTDPYNYSGERILEGFGIETTVSKDALMGYLRSWSAYRTYCQRHPDMKEYSDDDPIQKIHNRLNDRDEYNDGNEIPIVWPVTLLLCVKQS